jgi:hypothetical protein
MEQVQSAFAGGEDSLSFDSRDGDREHPSISGRKETTINAANNGQMKGAAFICRRSDRQGTVELF